MVKARKHELVCFETHTVCEYDFLNTNSRCESLLHEPNELMVDVYGQVTENLSVFGQIKVLQAVLFLARGALFQETLTWTKQILRSSSCETTESLRARLQGSRFILPPRCIVSDS